MPTTASLPCPVLTLLRSYLRGGLSGWDMTQEVQAMRRDHDALAEQVTVQGTQQVTDNAEVCYLVDLHLIQFIFSSY